jgi:hypothetical protein
MVEQNIRHIVAIYRVDKKKSIKKILKGGSKKKSNKQSKKISKFDEKAVGNIIYFDPKKQKTDKQMIKIKKNIQNASPEYFIGKSVQFGLEFPDNKSDNSTVEWIWANVNKITTDNKKFIGKLENNSLYDSKLTVGTVVEFTQDEIRLVNPDDPDAAKLILDIFAKSVRNTSPNDDTNKIVGKILGLYNSYLLRRNADPKTFKKK